MVHYWHSGLKKDWRRSLCLLARVITLVEGRIRTVEDCFHITTCRVVTLCFFVTVFISKVQAQSSSQPFSSTYEVQKVPANPDVAQLGRFGDVPVEKYNGSANISVPIYEIDHDGLKIPITLKYNTSGIQVEQEASWVGLGWSLSDGMTITREVNGYEDIYNYDHLNANSIGWIYSRDFLFPNVEDNWASAGELSEYDLNEIQNSSRSGHNPVDTEPDLFTLTVPSGSCKFWLPKIQDNDTFLSAVVTDNKNFRVVYYHLDYTFKVIDPNGFVYHFTVSELSSGYGSYESTNTTTKKGLVAGIQYPIFHARHMISSWRVSKIVSPRGRELDFTYQDGFYFSYPHFTEDHDILSSGNFPYFIDTLRQYVSSVPRMAANMNAFNTKNLSLISGAFGSVEFVLTDRSDLVSKEDKIAWSGLPSGTMWNTYQLYDDSLIAKKVDQVIVRNKALEVIKSASFSYSYFNSQWVGVEPVHTATDPFECDVSYIRLKLDQVQIGDQKYNFQYYQPNSLPAKYSRSVDFWGYYNGASNATKIPTFNRFYTNHPGFTRDHEWHEFFVKVYGGNRGANFNYGKVGILEKVTYPTGGSTFIDYEGHRVTLSNVVYEPTEYLSNGSGQLRFTSLTSSLDYKYSYQYMKLAKTPTYSLYNTNACRVTSDSYISNTVFNVGETSFCNVQTYNVRINATISCTVGCGQGTPSGRAVWIRNINTGQEYNVFDHNTETTRTVESTISLPVGSYEMRTANWTQNSPLVVVTTSATVSAYFSIPPPATPVVAEEFEVGGARIKSLTNVDVDGSFISRTNYIYDQFATEDGQQVSNGKLMDDLVFHSKAQNLFDFTMFDFNENQGGQGAVLSSDNKIRTSQSARGSHIGYSQVREQKVDSLGNSLGQIVTQFSNKPNERVVKPSEVLPRITAYAGNLPDWDFHTAIVDLAVMGFEFYVVNYGSVYLLGTRPITHEFSNGSVLNEKIFNQSNNLVRETAYDYDDVPVHTYTTTAVGETVMFPLTYFIGDGLIHFQPFQVVLRSTYKSNMAHQLISVTTTEYFEGTPMTSVTNNYYDNTTHFLLARSSDVGSDGTVYSTKYYYPKDLPAVPFMNDLVRKNEVLKPVIVERYKGTNSEPYTTLLEKVQTFYSNLKSVTGDVLPSEVFTYALGDAAGHQRVVYEKYSNYGTLTQYRKNSADQPVALVWGHDKQFPIAQVLNAESSQVAFTSFDEPAVEDGGWSFTGTTTTSAAKTGAKSANSGSTMSKTGLPSGDYVVGFWARLVSGSSGTVTVSGTTVTITDPSWKYYIVANTGTSITVSNTNVYLDELRLHPAGAQMTSYTYKPLLGMTSVTDANGMVRYFEYDSAGRLRLVRDSDGNILKTAAYRFAR